MLWQSVLPMASEKWFMTWNYAKMWVSNRSIQLIIIWYLLFLTTAQNSKSPKEVSAKRSNAGGRCQASFVTFSNSKNHPTCFWLKKALKTSRFWDIVHTNQSFLAMPHLVFLPKKLYGSMEPDLCSSLSPSARSLVGSLLEALLSLQLAAYPYIFLSYVYSHHALGCFFWYMYICRPFRNNIYIYIIFIYTIFRCFWWFLSHVEW